jgi:hypothetical protein
MQNMVKQLEIAQDTHKGLSFNPKYLMCGYFYDSQLYFVESL